MTIKDGHGNTLTLYQARSGAVMLQFGNQAIELTKIQVEALVTPYDINDFHHAAYISFYA
ncbi:hypothetical protein E3T26_06915 [Cryobacterium sp. TMT1-21]|uniref:hypothetical protein n=1 Tax=Cryobacterium sp. TMT1-21 TaxID=1259234 RepID=UPI00106C3B21|nr:hypothetical protein [Cryobacterium sp. TMT1-21]TFD15507.1 hypothetical protein E3T26_06915 [Cryobacterium sp. TMT1-21]